MVNFKSPVGGIIYRPLENKNIDIYGEEINFNDLLSYKHQPVQVKTPTQGYQKQYHYGERNQESTKKSDQTPQSAIRLVIPTSGKTITSDAHIIESGVQVGNMQRLLDEAAKHGIYFRVTSGYRPGAKTSSEKTSWHSSGEAIDVTPLSGHTWDELRTSIKNAPEFLTWMQNQGYGILDETTAEMLAKTNGTGAHFHIGKDKSALEGLKQFMV